MIDKLLGIWPQPEVSRGPFLFGHDGDQVGTLLFGKFYGVADQLFDL